MTAETLKRHTCKDLAEMAKKRGVRGWHAMKKEQLVKALLRAGRSRSSNSKTASRRSSSAVASSRRNGSARAALNGKAASGKASNGKKPVARNGTSNGNRRVQKARAEQFSRKDLSGKGDRFTKDRLVVMVRDAYWLHVYWELTRHGVERARAALGQQWHSARPVLRLLHVSSGSTTSSVERPIRDIEIHGGVNNWYIDVEDPPKSYRVDIGYKSAEGKFFALARSNVVTTPRAGSKDDIDENWTDVAAECEKIFAMSGGYDKEHSSGDLQELFEERLRRPMGSPLVTRQTPGVEAMLPGKREFNFTLDAELIVYGASEPDAAVTLQGEPIKLRPDGTFTVRYSLPNCRQVIPAVACSADGVEQRTIVLAVERNTKTMEPLIRDGSE